VPEPSPKNTVMAMWRCSASSSIARNAQSGAVGMSTRSRSRSVHTIAQVISASRPQATKRGRKPKRRITISPNSGATAVDAIPERP
jgi:hypothetical protein